VTDPFIMLAEVVRARDEHWRQDAACRGLPTGWFYPEVGNSADPRALAACAACTVRDECWADGVNEQYGVWAGVTRKDRKRPPGPLPINHGTDGGYATHLRRGEVACDECKRAHASHVAIHKNPSGRRPGRPVGGEWGVNLTGTFGRRRVMDDDVA
jgi:hypothetical protein